MSYPVNTRADSFPYGLSKRAPKPINAARAPATTDVGYDSGSIWVNKTGTFSTDAAYINLENGGGLANWKPCAGGSVIISTITGDSGGALSPSNGNFNILGTANQITTSGSGSTLTLSLIGPYTPATYTAHGVLVGEGTSSIVALAVGTTGQVLIGATGADPAFGALGVNSGLTAHGVLLGEGNSAIVATAVGATGTVLAGSTGADPAFTATPAVTSITFGAGNALNSYVENTAFTPVVAFGGASVGITYTTQIGRYMKIGKMVIWSVNIVLSNKGSSTGSATISGLPFVSAATDPANYYSMSAVYTTITMTAANIPALVQNQGASVLSIGEVPVAGGATAALADTAFANTSSIFANGYYFAAT